MDRLPRSSLAVLLLFCFLLVTIYRPPSLFTLNILQREAPVDTIKLSFDTVTLRSCNLSISGSHLPCAYAFDKADPGDVIASYTQTSTILLTCSGIELSNAPRHVDEFDTESTLHGLRSFFEVLGFLVLLIFGLNVLPYEAYVF